MFDKLTKQLVVCMAEEENEQEKLRRIAVTYENEGAALEAAKRIAQLKAGDEVYVVGYDSDVPVRCIFSGNWDEGGTGLLLLQWNPKSKHIQFCCVSPSLIKLD